MDFCDVLNDETSSSFRQDDSFKIRTIKQLVALRLADVNTPRLLLPPIQRSLVWSNEQIINYWDSLLRGYPAGMMMFHLVETQKVPADVKGRDADGKTCVANRGDWQLFDGQQRLASILLGLHEGQLKNSHKLWVDLGEVPEKSSGLRFQLRMSSVGQPFGYRSSAPNQKFETNKRKSKWIEWKAKNYNVALDAAFHEVTGKDIIDAKCALGFSYACALLNNIGKAKAVFELCAQFGLNGERVEIFMDALEKAMNCDVILQQVAPVIVSDQEEYVRFFGRLGQGGTRLSEDELTYSIIKNQFPEIHDRMVEIMREAGQLAGEIDLVLATVRIAKTTAKWDDAQDSEVISRPTPAFVSKMDEKGNVRSEFVRLMGLGDETSILKSALVRLREALQYDRGTHPKGLPRMLLARMPRELTDVLILFAVKRGANLSWEDNDRETLNAFVLYWMLVVADDGKAALQAFRSCISQYWSFTQTSIRKLINDLEREGVARVLPRRDALNSLYAEVQRDGPVLRMWQERFTAVDSANEKKPGEALRVMSTNPELIKRALIWLQRSYILEEFPDYDPTSDRDEDLPVDLDHIIPHDCFGFDWRKAVGRLQKEAISDNFRWTRGVVGNSLGNYRWLSASENRGRGKGAYVPFEKNGDLDLVKDPKEWNALILRDVKDGWSKDDISIFQRLINTRTLELYEGLLSDSGIESLLGDGPYNPPAS